jgi:hypothetical protein
LSDSSASAQAIPSENWLVRSDAKKVLLSGNIANAAFAIIGLFGPGGQDPTISLLKEGFDSVRADIQELKGEMNDQFAIVDRALDTIYSSMQMRFTEIDDRLDVIGTRVANLADHETKL